MMVTVDQAAALTGVPVNTIKSWIRRRRLTPAGQLPGRGRYGILRLYRLEHIQELAAQRHTNPPPQRHACNQDSSSAPYSADG